ncbi:MAG: 3-deoxy-7-phosphoheptulonate synthase [Chloroflexota bacterium]
MTEGFRGLHNRNIAGFEPLPQPRALQSDLPATPEQHATVAQARAAVAAALRGADDRMLVIVGPCSIHDRLLAAEYAERLRNEVDRHRNDLIIVMRTYFEKPRTSLGWKGLIYDPGLDGSHDALRGLRTARSVLLDVLSHGVPCAVEVLDTITPQYYADLVSWAAIGARTVESQVHRQLASGLSFPVGFKNATDGRVDVAVNAVAAAVEGHAFFGVDDNSLGAVVRTTGNADSHVVLRGGDAGPNFDPSVVHSTAEAVRGVTGHARPVMVDCSHGNSGKDHQRQRLVVDSILDQWGTGGRNGLLGLMLESNLRPGRQDWEPQKPLEHGVSITDACIGWEETTELLERCAHRVNSTRG